MEVLSNYVLLENPFFGKKESVIQLTEAAQEEAIVAEMAKCKELTISYSGVNCLKVKAGDKVYIDVDRIMSAARVTKEDKDYFILRESDIIFIY